MTEDKNVDVIETYVMFATEVKVNVKVRKTTSYGSSEPEYELAEVAGIPNPFVVLDENTGMDVLGKIREEALNAVKKYESEIKGEGE